MALTSRRQRDLEQRRRMARGKRNLSQLAGPVAKGQRTPMNRGHGSVSSVQAPKFQQSNVGNDITQAGMAYKGAKGIRDWAGKSTGLQQQGGLLSDLSQNLMGGSPSNAMSLLGGGSGVMEALPGTYGAAGGIGNIPTGAFDSAFIGPTQPYNALSTSAADASGAAGAGSKGLMGTAGAALGAGLNIYDMTQQGVTAGNALGLGGSALLGLSNAWNPLGWAMLGTSAAGSLFDWW